MNLYKKSLPLIFFISLILTLFMPTIQSFVKIHFFIPFIVLLIYRKPLIPCLWGALLCGLILDLLSPHARIGLYAVNYTMTAVIIYRQKQHYFADSLTTLPIMTFFFSVISTILQVLLINVFEKSLKISNGWIWKDLVLLPSIDTAVAFCMYILPYVLFGKPIRKGRDYFMQEE